MTSVASDELLVLVIFVPQCGPQERVVLLRRRFAELACDAILIVAALDGCHGRGVGAEIPDRRGSVLATAAGFARGTFAAHSRVAVSARARRADVCRRAAALLRDLALLATHLFVEVAERLIEFFVAALAAARAAVIAERVAVGRAAATVFARAVAAAATTRGIGREVTAPATAPRAGPTGCATAAGRATAGCATTAGRATAGRTTAAGQARTAGDSATATACTGGQTAATAAAA